MLYTHDYVSSQKAKLIGILEASIKPIRFSQITKEYNIDASIIFGIFYFQWLFNSWNAIYSKTRLFILEIFDGLKKNGQIKGNLIGARQVSSAIFLPDFYVSAQKQYVESFLKQNGYIGMLYLTLIVK